MHRTPQSNMYCFLGTGGVGKTSLSAAFGIKLAKQGQKGIVITVDPARRLASSLGIDSLSDEVTTVYEDQSSGGRLDAVMPDTKQIFDRLVRKYAPSEIVYKRIMSNKFYENISTTLSGAHEFMVIEKLYQLFDQHPLDFFIIDTPPSNNVLAFLSAPNRMIRFCDDSIFKWFLIPYEMMGKKGFGLIKKGGDIALNILQRLAGMGLLFDLSEFFFNFKDMYQGIRHRASEIDQKLKGACCRYFFVCGASRDQLNEALHFLKTLNQQNVSIHRLLVNKVHRETEGLKWPNDLGHSESNSNLLALMDFLKKRSDFDRANISHLSEQMGQKISISQIPLLAGEINSIEGLLKLESQFDVD